MALLDFLRAPDDGSRRRSDDDPEVDHQMIAELGKVQPDELRDLPSHAGYCALRFKLLAAMGVTNNRQSRENARQMAANRTALVRYMVAGMVVLALIQLFGKDKGADVLLAVIKLLAA